MSPHGQVQDPALLAPGAHLPTGTARRDGAPIGVDRNGKNRVEGFGEDHLV